MNRRRFIIAGSALGAAVTGAPSSTFAAPATGRTVNGMFQSDTEVVFHHIWGTPPGQAEVRKDNPVENVINLFNEKKTGVTVKSRTDSGSYAEVLQKTQAELAAGKGPDLVSTPWAFIHWATEGLGLVNLEQVHGANVNDVLGNLREDVVPLVKIDDKTMGMPYAFSNPIFYYNQDILDAAGVKIDDILNDWDMTTGDAAKKLSEHVGGPIFGLADGQWPAQGISQSNGGFVMKDGKFAMDSAETIGAMDKVAAIDRAGLLNRSTRKEEDASFKGGALPICYYSVASLSGNREACKFNLGTHTFPKFGTKQRKMSAGGSFIGLYSRDENQRKASWEFLKFTASQEGYEPWSKMGYLNATKFDFPIVPGQEPAYEHLKEGVTPETPWPTARGGEFGKIWADMVSRIWTNDIKAEEGCKQVAAELNSAIGK